VTVVAWTAIANRGRSNKRYECRQDHGRRAAVISPAQPWLSHSAEAGGAHGCSSPNCRRRMSLRKREATVIVLVILELIRRRRTGHGLEGSHHARCRGGRAASVCRSGRWGPRLRRSGQLRGRQDRKRCRREARGGDAVEVRVDTPQRVMLSSVCLGPVGSGHVQRRTDQARVVGAADRPVLIVRAVKSAC